MPKKAQIMGRCKNELYHDVATKTIMKYLIPIKKSFSKKSRSFKSLLTLITVKIKIPYNNIVPIIPVSARNLAKITEGRADEPSAPILKDISRVKGIGEY